MSKAQLISFLIQFIVILGNLITYAIIGRVLISLFSFGNVYEKGRISQFIYNITDPVINVAKKIPHTVGMIDFSPFIALIGVDLLAGLIVLFLTKLL